MRIDINDDYSRQVAEFELHPHDDAHTFRFCPRCGGAFERRLLKATEPERLVCTKCAYVFYLDPKIAVGTIVRVASGRLVLVRRAIEPGYGKWVFPGGYVDRGEPLVTAAIREAREECGLEVRIDGEDLFVVAGHRRLAAVMAAIAEGQEITAIPVVPEPKGMNDVERTIGLDAERALRTAVRALSAEIRAEEPQL